MKVHLGMFQDKKAQNPGNTSIYHQFTSIMKISENISPTLFRLHNLNQKTMKNSQSFPCLCLAIGGSNKNWSKTQSLIASIRQCQSWSSCGLRLKGVAPAANGGAGEGFTALEKNLFLGPGALMSAPLSTSHFKFLATLEF